MPLAFYKNDERLRVINKEFIAKCLNPDSLSCRLQKGPYHL